MPTSSFDTLTQKKPSKTSLSEEGRKNPIVVGVACTLLFHVLLVLVAPLLPVDKLTGSHSNLDAINARKDKSFDFELEPLPETDQLDPMKFVETNPDAPVNDPDKTANFSNRNQQTAQEEAAQELDANKRPTVKGRTDIENSSAIVAGDHLHPQEGAAVAPNDSQTDTKEQPSQQARAEQIPLSGFEKTEGASEDGIASNISKNPAPTNNANEYAEGAKDGKDATGSLVSTLQSSKPQPRPRPKLTQARQNVLSNQIAGTSNIGVLGIDARWSEYGDYMQELIEIVQAQWYTILRDSAISSASGTHVYVTFVLNAKGEVRVLKVEETAGKPGTYACLNAIQERQPYRKWSDQMITVLGTEQTMTFSFYHQ